MAIRNIKFQYFVGVRQRRVDNTQWETIERLDIESWINKSDAGNLSMRTIQLSKTMARIERTHYLKDAHVWTLKFYKLREDNIPSIVEENVEAREIPLEENEYIGEELHMLYDNDIGVAMLQINRFALGTRNLEELLTTVWGIDGERIRLIPVIDFERTRGYRGKHYRALEVTFANITTELSDSGNALNQIMNSYRRFGGFSGKVSVSIGRSRYSTLNKNEVEEFVSDALDDPAVTGCKMIIKDDDDSKVETIDLFDKMLTEVIGFDIEKKTTISFAAAEASMTYHYRQRKEQLIRLVGTGN